MEVGKLTTHTAADGFSYLRFLPIGWTKESNAPVLVFLHGSGGLDNEKNIRGQSLGFKLAQPEFASGVKHIVLIPIAPKRPWSLHFESVMAILELGLSELGGDPERVAVTGQSIGGNGAWEVRLPRRGAYNAARRRSHAWCVRGASAG